MFHPALPGLESAIRDHDLALELASVTQFQSGFALDAGLRTGRQRRLSPASSVFIQLQSLNSCFHPGQHGEWHELSTGIEEDIFSIHFHDNNICVQSPCLHSVAGEEVVSTVGNPHS